MDLGHYQKQVLKLKKEIKNLEEKLSGLDSKLKNDHKKWIASIELRDKRSKAKKKEQETLSNEIELALGRVKGKEIELDEIRALRDSELTKARDKAVRDERKVKKTMAEYAKMKRSNADERASIEKKVVAIADSMAEVKKLEIKMADMIANGNAQKAMLDAKEESLAQSEKRIDALDDSFAKRSKALNAKELEVSRREKFIAKIEADVTKKEAVVAAEYAKLAPEKETLKKTDILLKKKKKELDEMENNLVQWNQKLIKRDQLRQNAK